MNNDSSHKDNCTGINIRLAHQKDIRFIDQIITAMESSARARGTGIAKRSPESIAHHIDNGNAVIAVTDSDAWAGFCYIDVYDGGKFVSHSGLIVAPAFRDRGIAHHLKHEAFNLCRKKYPCASIVGITTSHSVMNINTGLGFYPTTFADLPVEEKFWKGCASCVNCDILNRTGRKYCLCSAMRFDPVQRSVTR